MVEFLSDVLIRFLHRVEMSLKQGDTTQLKKEGEKISNLF